MRLSKGKFKPTRLSERIIMNHLSFVFFNSSFLYKSFNKKLTQLVESGLAERYVNEFANPYPIENEDGGPVVLTFDHLSVGFQIWLLFLFVSFVSFLVEQIVHKMINNITKR